MNKKILLLAGFILVSAFSVVWAQLLNSPSSPLDTSIVKQFVYDIDPTYPPVIALDVQLWNSVGIVDTEATNATGYVTFIGLKDETYTLKWMWGGVEDSESKQIDCTKILWDLGTNYLESKSGEGNYKTIELLHR